MRTLIQWKRDLILKSSPATTGNAEDMGLHLIVLAMLKLDKHEPRLDTRGAKIDKAGNLFAWMFRGLKDPIERTQLGKVDHVRDALRRLADHCKLSDGDRNKAFEALANWIKHDDRANDPRGERVRQ